MAARETTRLTVKPREPGGSRTTRRLRREGKIPGVVYGGGDEPITFSVHARELRQALARGGAVIDLSIAGGDASPVVVKDEQRDPRLGSIVHLDLLRVRLDRAIQATTILELTGTEDAPGVKEGGVLEQVTHELNIEALPNAIPDFIEHDVSAMDINDTVMLDAVSAPEGVTLLDDLAETVVATLSPPRVEEEPETVEAETELVGEAGEEAPADADADAEQTVEGGDSGGDDSGGE